MTVGISRLFREIPTCPLCDGPCTHDFPRSEYRFSDRLPVTDDRSADPKPEPAKKPNRRGRRPEHHAPEGPQEDRMVRPESDR